MQLDVAQVGGTYVVTPRGNRIDAGIAPALRALLLEHIEQGHLDLVVDLSAVQFIDSSGLGALVSAVKRIGRDGQLKVCGLNESVRSMFELTRLDRVIPVTAVPFAAAGDRT